MSRPDRILECCFAVSHPSAVVVGFVLVLAVLHPHEVSAEGFGDRLAAAALERTRHEIRYSGAYVRIDYPGGDVPADTGVCTDVLIRAYRALGVDLQVLVHEDMAVAFDAYPRNWGLTRPDRNIDHRRVPNLRRFFARHGQEWALAATPDFDAFRPGDIVSFRLDGRLPHIGIVSDRRSTDGERPLVVHNVGAGPRLEDVLSDEGYERTGWYRYAPP